MILILFAYMRRSQKCTSGKHSPKRRVERRRAATQTMGSGDRRRYVANMYPSLNRAPCIVVLLGSVQDIAQQVGRAEQSVRSSTYDVLFCIDGRSGDILYYLLILPAHVPVVNEARALHGLRCCVRRVTCEEQVISGLDTPCWGEGIVVSTLTQTRTN